LTRAAGEEIVTLTGREVIPLTTTRRVAGPGAICRGRVKYVEETTLGATDILVIPDVLA
jgi:hypothetical protein